MPTINHPNIPVFMGEANFEYETNGVAAGAEDGGSPHILRMQEYWTMLSGATGQLYGNRYHLEIPARLEELSRFPRRRSARLHEESICRPQVV